MDLLSQTEENYLKAIYKVSEGQDKPAGTTAISQEMSTSAASVSDMLKRLAEKELIHYARYKGVTLTEEGHRLATHLIRKHRLWETFLVDKLNFAWDEVHEIAEQLEHIHSLELVERLDEFLNRPKFDPHGDPIPDKDGKFTKPKRVLLSELDAGQQGVIVGVNDHSTSFLQYLERLGLTLGVRLRVEEVMDYDQSVRVAMKDGQSQLLTAKVSQNLYLQRD